LVDTQNVIGAALTASFAASLAPEALTLIAPDPWPEILRVAGAYNCESLLVGFSAVASESTRTDIERLLGEVDANVIVLRTPPNWNWLEVERILVPVRGRGDQSRIRARLLGSLGRSRTLQVSYLGILPEGTSEDMQQKARRGLSQLAQDEAPGQHQIEVVASDDTAAEIIEHANGNDLVVLGARRLGRRRKLLGEIPLSVIQETKCGVMLISQRG
jgi:APA family basic amino acid/polyamine antiporter